MNGSRFRKLLYDKVNDAIQSSSNNSAVYIGCDSKHADACTVFGLVVVIHIEQRKGGMVFGKKSRVDRRMSINERLIKEVDIAMECAFMLSPFIGERIFEVHLDINPDPRYKSNSVAKYAHSYVKAQGFDYRIKPKAWAATTAADYLLG